MQDAHQAWDSCVRLRSYRDVLVLLEIAEYVV